jgi:hypothetical protein
MQEELEEPNDIQRSIFQIIEVQQRREMLNEKSETYQSKVKLTSDKKTKNDSFKIGDLVLRWGARMEEKPKHGKFDNLWFGPFKITKIMSNNNFVLQNLDDSEIFGGPVNGCFLKHYFTSRARVNLSCTYYFILVCLEDQIRLHSLMETLVYSYFLIVWFLRNAKWVIFNKIEVIINKKRTE